MLGKLNDTQIEEVLANNVLGRIGCHDDGRTYIVPINYVYDGKNIIAHSTPGMKIQMMRHNPQVCFEVDEMIDFSNWKSVIVWGEYQEINDPISRSRAMKYFADRMLQVKISETALVSDEPAEGAHHMVTMARPIIYRIVILEKTGRFERR